MSSLLASVAQLLPKFITGNGFKEYSKRYPSCYFLRLPLLIYLDYIFPCLTVEDIICLRRVCPACPLFCILTNQHSGKQSFLPNHP